MSDDWPQYGPGAARERSGRDSSGLSPSQALHAAWRSSTELLAVELPDVKWTVQRTVFNKHCKQLRDAGFDVETIKGMFTAFANDVLAGRVPNLHGKTAWFVFYGRRHHYTGSRPTAPPAAAQPRRLRSLRDRG